MSIRLLDRSELKLTKSNAGSGLLLPPVLLVCGLIAAMSGVGMLLMLTVPGPVDATVASHWWVLVAIGITFAAAESAVFNVTFRRHAISFSLSEIPFVLSLCFSSPVVAIAVRLLFSVPVLILKRRGRGVKLLFNLTSWWFELAVGFALFRVLLSWWGTSTPILVVAAVCSSLVTAPLTSVCVSSAIAAYEGGIRQQILSGLAATWWLYPVTSLLGGMTLALSLLDPVLLLIAVLPTSGMWLVLHRYGVAMQHLRDLDTIHGFTERIGDSLDPNVIGEAAAEELFSLLRVNGVALLRFADDAVRVHTRGLIELVTPDSKHSSVWAGMFASHGARVLVPAERDRFVAGVRDETPVLWAPLWDAGEVYGAVIAVVQWSVVGGFADDERKRLASLTHQLSVSLRRGMLHERLEHEARHDALTGLPGRTLFEQAVVSAVRSTGRSGTPSLPAGTWSVLMLDLDRFKEVNDTLGHHAGDALLVEFSRRLAALLGPEDILARLAGDEFALLCHRATSGAVMDVAAEVVRVGGKPVVLDGLEIVVTVSVGVADIDAHDLDALQPMRRADIAMYNAKWQRSGVEAYRDEIDRRTPARLSMLGDLRLAIEHGDLDVVYQPKLDLRTGRVVGAEALVRWEHASRGVVAPAEFVRVAEDTGLIKELTDLVLARGICALRGFEDRGLPIGLAVNLSTHDLFDGRLPDRVRRYLADNGVSPDKLTLEITESSLLVDVPRTRATIDELHSVGLSLAVDDFGTGYSSLSYLRRLPVQELKIDQSFVMRMLSDPQDEVIVRSTIDLGHNLGLRVVAEGAECDATVEQLRSFGCDVVQGFAISAPMSESDLADWMSASRAASRDQHSLA